MVILAFCANNDISNNLSNDEFEKPKPYFTLNRDELHLHDAHGARATIAAVGGRASFAQWRPRLHLLDLARLVLSGQRVSD